MNYKRAKTVLCVYDGPVIQDENGQVYGDENTWKRYLVLGTNVVNLIRVVHKKASDCHGIPLDDDRYTILEVPDFKSLRGILTTRLRVKKIIEQAVINADVVVARLPSGTGSMAVYYANKYQKPLLTEMVGCTRDVYWHHSLKGKMIAHYYYFKQLKVMKMVDYCVYVTQSFLQKRYRITGKAIGCSDVIIGKLDPFILEKRLQEMERNVGKRPLMLGSVGLLSLRLKGYLDVIYALGKLKKQGVIFQYRLVGRGDTTYLQKAIRKLDLESEVTIMGPIPHDEIFDFLDSTDIYIQPSRTEGLPRAMVEAMSRGCAVIGSRVGGIPELIHRGSSFDPGNVNQIMNVLVTYTKEKLASEMVRSYQKAKEYETEALDEKRRGFYEVFLADHQLSAGL